jgi:hypothetical protein
MTAVRKKRNLEALTGIMPQNARELYKRAVAPAARRPNMKGKNICYRLDQAMPSGSVPTASVLVTFREATSTKVNRLAAELVM